MSNSDTQNTQPVSKEVRLEDLTPNMALPHNIFADMGMSDPETRQAKAMISIVLSQRIDALGLSDTEAAKRMGLNEADLSKIMRGINSGFDLDRLLEALAALDDNANAPTDSQRFLVLRATLDEMLVRLRQRREADDGH